MGDRVRRLREESGMTQVALANLAGLSTQSIKDIEAGRKGTGLKVVLSLSKAFGISMEEFLGENPPSPRLIKPTLKEALEVVHEALGVETTIKLKPRPEVDSEVIEKIAKLNQIRPDLYLDLIKELDVYLEPGKEKAEKKSVK